MNGPRLTGSRCQCCKCGEIFNSTSTFTRHRVGNWESLGANRRCLNPDQMTARGWSRNPEGFWIERKRIDAARIGRDVALPINGQGEGTGGPLAHVVA